MSEQQAERASSNGNASSPSLLTRLQSSFSGANAPASSIPNETSKFPSNDQISDTLDVMVVSGDMVGKTSNLTQVNQTSRDFFYEPEYIRQLINEHTPFKYTITPAFASFDDDGVARVGNITDRRVNIFPGSFVPIIGYAFRIKARDTQRGLTRLLVRSTSGFITETQLADIDQEAVLVVLNHRQDISVNLTAELVAVPVSDANPNGQVVVSYETIESEVSEQFFFETANSSLIGNGDQKFSIEGSNLNVDIYPIPLTRDVVALINTLIFDDAIENLPGALANAYSQKRGRSNG